jgi:catalase
MLKLTSFVHAFLCTTGPQAGLIIAPEKSAGADDFVAAIAKHRHFARETDPPRV